MQLSLHQKLKLPTNRTRRTLLAGIACLGFLMQPIAWASDSDNSFTLQGTLFDKVGKKTNIDPALLYAIACVESSIAFGKKNIRPHPWTLRTINGPWYGESKEETIAELRRLRSAGLKSIDVGMFQINTRWHGHRVRKIEDLVDPETNMTIAAGILDECLKRSPKDAFTAIGNYHSSDRMKAQKYAVYVINVYSRIKK